MAEPYIILTLWLINLVVDSLFILYFKKTDRKSANYSEWPLGIII